MRTGRLDHRLNDRRRRREDSHVDWPILAEALDDVEPSIEEPIIILGTAWRSGSTLLQRLASSSGQALVWGEPWHRCDLVPRLTESLRAVSQEWPADRFSLTRFTDGELRDQWIANLFPDLTSLLDGHRSLILDWLAAPARDLGYERWGLKAVRFDGDHARYLRLLFPDARIVVVHRDPREAWPSYRAAGFESYRRYPERPVRTAHDFAKTWVDVTRSLLDAAGDVGAMVIAYDTLTQDPNVADDLATDLGVDIDRAVLDEQVGGSTRTHGLARSERRTIERIAGRTMGELGYD